MIIKLAIAAASIAGLLAANPASAQETATAAAITGVVDAPSGTATGDAEFSELFASWQGIDGNRVAGGAQIMVAQRPQVSVPSLSPVSSYRLSSAFGMRYHPVLGGQRGHEGVDLAAPSGTPIYAPADGLVSRADRFGSYGNFIMIEHGGELQTRYGHLSGFNVHAGERVTKGQLIGYVGSTGRSTGPHLHYEVRVAGEPVDPSPYMAETGVVQTDGSGRVQMVAAH